jgi:Protein of unknown function (DUF3551)
VRAKEHCDAKKLFTLAGLILAMLLHTGPVHAQNYPWCAQYSGDVGGQNCGFNTLQQCRATVSGVGGFCFENPMAQVNQPRRRNRERLF